MQEQKMIDESLLLRYFEQEVSEEEKKKVEEWIHSSEANSRMAKQVARIFVATRLLHGSKEASPQQALQDFWSQVERKKHRHLAIYRKGGCDISSPRSYSDYCLLVFR